MRLRRPALPILAKLLLAYVVPTLLLFAGFAFFAHEFARQELEAELGRRLSAIASSTASQIRGAYLVSLGPGDEGERQYQNTLRKLEAVRVTTGVARISVFRPDGTSLCDTEPGVPIGETYHALALDRHELTRVLEGGAAVSSVLFRGKDGQLHKAGYAPVPASETDAAIVGGLRVEAPAAYFQRLGALRRDLLRSGAALAAVVVLVSVLVATLLTRPVRRLAAAAERIGRGDLAAPVAPAGGDEIGRLARTLDEMRQALRARDERLHMMLAGIAHEVRNPLGGIELFAGILRDELGADPERLAHVHRIEKELGHLKAVVTDFLDYARRPKPEVAPVDLGALLDDVIELARADADGAKVALASPGGAAPLGGERLRVDGDGVQLKRAFLNLLRNAIQATEPGGQVTVRADADGEGGVAVSVADSGRGIPAELIEKIFTPFYTTKEKGTGLGLAFVKEIVTDHGARLEVASEPGRGTTFTVRFRAAGRPRAAGR